MMKTAIYYLISGFVLLSCQPKSEKTEKVNSVKAKETIEPKNKSIEKNVEANTFKTADELLNFYVQLKAKYANLLLNSSETEANNHYVHFKKECQEITSKLYDLESKMLEDYDGMYDEDGYFKMNGKYGSIFKKYLKAGLEFWYVGEGMTEIRMRPAELPTLFSGRLTNDYQEFMELEELDNRELIFNDAALSISLEQFASIVYRWERFVQKYPKSKLKPEAKEIYASYQMYYILGLDNTPVMEYSDGLIYPENKANFEYFMNVHPESPTTKLIQTLLSLEGNHDEMVKAVQNQQNKILKKM